MTKMHRLALRQLSQQNIHLLLAHEWFFKNTNYNLIDVNSFMRFTWLTVVFNSSIYGIGIPCMYDSYLGI